MKNPEGDCKNCINKADCPWGNQCKPYTKSMNGVHDDDDEK